MVWLENTDPVTGKKSKDFFLATLLLTAPIVKNSHIKARIYFTFLENVLKQTWKTFNTKFQPQ